MNLPLYSWAESKKLRDRGIEAVSSFPNDLWVAKARSIAEMLAAKSGNVTINDVLKICPRPEGVHPNAVGSVMRSKHLRLVSFTQSDKTSAHARRIGIYEYQA